MAHDAGLADTAGIAGFEVWMNGGGASGSPPLDDPREGSSFVAGPATGPALLARNDLLSLWLDDPAAATQTLAGKLSGADPGEALVALEQDAASQKQTVIADAGRQADDLARAAPTTCVDRDQLLAKVDQTVTRELGELQAAYQRQLEGLEQRLAAQVALGAAEKARNEAAMAAHLGAGHETMTADRDAHDDAWDKQRRGHQRTLDDSVISHSRTVHAQTVEDTSGLLADAETQAQAIRQNGDDRAREVREKARAEAAAARKTAIQIGEEARRAAELQTAHVQGVDGEGHAEVRTLGLARQMAALGEGQRRAREIEERGEARAQELETQAARQAEAHLARAREAADRMRGRSGAGTERLRNESGAVSSQMRGHASEALAKMDAISADAVKQGQAESAAALASVDDGTLAAGAARHDGKAQLARVYAEKKKEIEARGQAERDKIARTKDADLCRLAGEVDREMAILGKAGEDGDAALGQAGRSIEDRVAAHVAANARKLKAATAKAIAAIDRLVAAARKKICAASAGVGAAIDATAKAGAPAVDKLGPEILAEVTAAHRDERDDVAKLADADRTRQDLDAAEHVRELGDRGASVRDDIERQMLDDALGGIGVPDGETFFTWGANTATRIGSLPKHLRSKAMDKLPEEQFQTFLRECPPDRRSDLKALAKVTTDPTRKAALLAAYHTVDDDRELDDNPTPFVKDKDDADSVDLNDIHQGKLGDCFFMSSIGALALHNPEKIKRMIRENRDEDGDIVSYTVTLKKKVDDVWVDVPVTVDPTFIPRGKSASYLGDDDGSQKEMWPQLLEKAYARLEGGYDEIDGGWPADAMETLVGEDSEKEDVDDYGYEQMQRDLAAKKGVVISTRNVHFWSRGVSDGLAQAHSYTVVRVETDAGGTQWVVLNNPWGGPGAQVRIPYEQISDDFDDVAVNAGVGKP